MISCNTIRQLGLRANLSKHIARPSLSYTVIGMRKPDGGYRKALMHKPAKGLVRKPTPLGKESAESSCVPLRFKRMVKPPIRGQPAGFFSDSDDEQLLVFLNITTRSISQQRC